MYGGLSECEGGIIGEAYSSTEAWSNLEVLCDDYGGRVAGTPMNREAAEFLLKKFEEYGFEEPHLESFRFMGCETGASRLEVVGSMKRDITCLALPMTVTGEAEGEVYFLDSDGEYDEEDLSGKIVVSHTHPNLVREEGTGVAGFIWMHPYPSMGQPTGCVHSSVPSVSIRYEDGMILKRLIRRYGEVRVRIMAECDIFERESWNVCGEIKGNGENDEFILLGAHYDGHEIAQAAFDCGSSCAAVTEIGRILNEERENLGGDVRVICFSAEEFGCWGSKDYVKRHEDELSKLRFTYQLDCCGGGNLQMVTTDYWPQLEDFYDQISSDMMKKIPHDQRRGPGDSRAFFERGIPTGSITDYRQPGMLELLKTYRHTEYDTLDKIDPRSLREAAAIGAVSSIRILDAETWLDHKTGKEVKEAKDYLS